MGVLDVIPDVRAVKNWTLGELSGLMALWDFTDPATLFTDTTMLAPVVSNDDVVAAVADKSGHAYHLSNSTSFQRPLYKTGIYGALSGLWFDGINDYLATAVFAGGDLAQPNTIFAVAQTTATGTTQATITDGVEVGKSHYLGHAASGTDKFEIFGGASVIGSVAGDTSNHIFVAIFDGASSGIYVDGGTATTGNAGAQALSGVVLGSAQAAPSALWVGDMALVAVFAGRKSVDEINHAGAYLAYRCSLSWTTAV